MRLHGEVVEDEDVAPCPGREELSEPPVEARGGELGERPRRPQVERAVAGPDRGHGQGAREIRLADPGRSDDEDLLVGGDPARRGQIEQDAAVEPPSRPEVDVLDRGRQAELGRPQVALEPTVLPFGHLPVDEQAEPVLERKGPYVVGCSRCSAKAWAMPARLSA